MTRNEFKFVKSILKPYYEYLMENPKSFIIKFYGLHKIWPKKKSKFLKGEKFYFLIMENIFNST